MTSQKPLSSARAGHPVAAANAIAAAASAARFLARARGGVAAGVDPLLVVIIVLATLCEATDWHDAGFQLEHNDRPSRR
jgi:hypothetical protein